MIFKRVSTDTKHLVMLFDNGDIVLLRFNNLEVVGRWSLRGQVADVADIICTNAEQLTVLVISSNKDNEKQTILQEYSKGMDIPKQYCFEFQFSCNCYGLSCRDEIFSVLDVKEDTCKIVCVHFRSQKIQTPIRFQVRLQHISYSNSTSLVCAWSNNDEVVVLDVENGTVMCKLTARYQVTCARFSARDSVLLVGGNDGSISLYDTRNGNLCTNVKGHDCEVQHLIILDDVFISHSGNKMLVWSTRSLLERPLQVTDERRLSSSQRLLDQQTVNNVTLSYGNQEFVTADRNGVLKVWRFRDGGFVKEFLINMVAKKIVMCGNEICCVLGERKELKLFDLQTSEALDFELPKDVCDVTVGKDLTSVYTIGMNGSFLHISIVDLKLKTVRKSFALHSVVKFENLEVCLSQNERYICLRLKVIPEEYENIKRLCEEKSYSKQDHPHKFIAIDLQQATGGLMPCVRNFSTVPHLGEDICPHTGNSMIINRRDWVIFWDIPTGKPN
jgi:WD40 repeat protein